MQLAYFDNFEQDARACHSYSKKTVTNHYSMREVVAYSDFVDSFYVFCCCGSYSDSGSGSLFGFQEEPVFWC